MGRKRNNNKVYYYRDVLQLVYTRRFMKSICMYREFLHGLKAHRT